MNRFAAITIIAVALFATLVLLVVFHADHVAEDAVAAAIGVALPVIIRFLAGSGDGKDSTVEKGAGPLAVLAVAGAALFAHGCADPKVTPQNVENVEAVVQYELLLTSCREQGKKAKSYEIYEACAAAVDRKLCAESGVRCVDGGAK